MQRVFRELNHYREIAYIGPERARLLFAALDNNGENAINESEFLATCDLLEVRLEIRPIYLTAHCSRLPTNYSLLTTHYSLLTAHYQVLTTDS